MTKFIARKNPARRTKFVASRVGDDPCFNCGKPGSTCEDCRQVICAVCNKQPYAPAGHNPSAHLKELPRPVEAPLPKMELAPFETDRCEMCGVQRAAMRYCRGACVPALGGFRAVGVSTDKHMHRTCSQCGYEWLTTINAAVDAT